MNTLPIKTLLGLNNKAPRDKLSSDKATFVADAVNVDFYKDGKFISRKGVNKFLVMDKVHSLYSNYFVSDGTLYYLHGNINNPSITPVINGLVHSRQLAYTFHIDKLCCSTADAIYVLDKDYATIYGVSTPGKSPNVSSGDGGSLPKGTYAIAICFRDEYGNRSGASVPVYIDVQDKSYIYVNDIEQKQGLFSELYISSCNGTELFLYGTIIGTSAYIPIISNQGRRLEELFKTTLPPGNILASYSGRLFSASGNMLFFTDTWSHLHDPIKNYIAFDSPITMVMPCSNAGMYISTSKTYWLSGEILSDSMQLKEILPYPAIANTCGVLNDGKAVYWLSENGFIIGNANGEVVDITKNTLAVKPAEFGASFLRNTNGAEHIIASTFGASGTSTAAKTFMDAEVIHNQPI